MGNYLKMDSSVMSKRDDIDYKPKVLILRQIKGLSANVISRQFGVVGKAYVDAIREELINELVNIDRRVCGYQDLINTMMGRFDSDSGKLSAFD
jgi:hypothetical protein